MDILLNILSIGGYIILGIISLILTFYTCKYIGGGIIDFICVLMCLPFYTIAHPIRLFTNPKSFFYNLFAWAPIFGQKIRDKQENIQFLKYKEEFDKNMAKRTPEERARVMALINSHREFRERSYELYGKKLAGLYVPGETDKY